MKRQSVHRTCAVALAAVLTVGFVSTGVVGNVGGVARRSVRR